MKYLVWIIVIAVGFNIWNYQSQRNDESYKEFSMTVKSKFKIHNEKYNLTDYIIIMEKDSWFNNEIWYCHTIDKTLWTLYIYGDEESFVLEDARPSRDNFECFATKHELSSYLNEY